MQSALTLVKSDSDPSIDSLHQLKHTIAFQISNSDEAVTLVAGALSHQTIRMASAKLDGIEAYKGLDFVSNCPGNQSSRHMPLVSGKQIQ